LPTEKEVHPTVKALERKVTDLAGRLEYLETHDPSADLSRLFGQISDLREHMSKLEERLSEIEAELHDMRVVFLSDVWRTALDELKALTARMDAIEQRLASVPPKTAPRSQPARPVELVGQSSESSELPAGLVVATTFARQHGISDSGIKKALTSGRVPRAPGGPWKIGRAWVMDMLDEQGRRAFVQEFRNNPNYHPCDDAQCMCHEYTAVEQEG
jgi:hypothetical protein